MMCKYYLRLDVYCQSCRLDPNHPKYLGNYVHVNLKCAYPTTSTYAHLELQHMAFIQAPLASFDDVF